MLHLNKVLLIIFSIFLFPKIALADNKSDISIEKNEVRKYGDSIYIDYNIVIKRIDLESDRYLTLTPVIATQGQIKELKSVVINGNGRHKQYKRSISLNYPDANYRVLSAKECEPTAVIPYTVTIAYQNWMQDAKIELAQQLCDCGGKSSEQKMLVIADNIEGIAPIPFPLLSTTYIAPAKEVAKNRELSGEAFVVFPVSKYDLIPELAQNNIELSKINQSIDYVNEVPNVNITRITIEAYASPEGYVQSNITLSQNRANSLKEHVKALYGLGEGLFTTRSKGENWDGLFKALDTISFTDTQKNDIREIIKTEDISKRKNKLKAYNNGTAYGYLLANIYPQLRRSEYKIEYTIPVYTIEQAKELLKTKPGVLSLDELYQIANSYEKGSSEFKEVFDIAVRLYPNDVIANLNAAAIELDMKNTEKAARYLSSELDNKQAYNNIGVLYAQKKELDKAIYYLKKAIDTGDKTAQINLNKLEDYQNITSNIKKH